MNAHYLLRIFQYGILCILVICGVVLAFQLQQPELPGSAATLDSTERPTTQDPVLDSLARVGKALWRENGCGSCHDGSMRRDMTAPALAGVSERWSAWPRQDLYRRVRNSQRMIAEGHPRAVEVWTDHTPRIMSNYMDLEDEDVEAILVYIAAVSRG